MSTANPGAPFSGRVKIVPSLTRYKGEDHDYLEKLDRREMGG
jgi:hypothetical protein